MRYIVWVAALVLLASCAYNPSSDPGSSYWAGVSKEIKNANVSKGAKSP